MYIYIYIYVDVEERGRREGKEERKGESEAGGPAVTGSSATRRPAYSIDHDDLRWLTRDDLPAIIAGARGEGREREERRGESEADVSHTY